jgi:flavorubredoxin
MISWLGEENLLFSQDAFGMHLASSGRFDDEIDPAVLDEESATYFANILLPYAALIGKTLDKVGAMGGT